MSPSCPNSLCSSSKASDSAAVARYGSFYRKSDGQVVQRYRCQACKKGFSAATSNPCYRQNKRHKNSLIYQLLASSVSQRRAARIAKLNRKTVVRKFLFLAEQAKLELEELNRAAPKAQALQFDDMETFEHTKCKPLSITVAVESNTRRILGLEVSKMPANGLLAEISVKKYGKRADERTKGREILFTRIKDLIEETAEIRSDQNPHYPKVVKEYFPKATHVTYKGQRGAITGQGELKKVGFDPLFSLNHTCAKLRADINRLVRRTWCTTKKPERLQAHLNLYAIYHNLHLPKKQAA